MSSNWLKRPEAPLFVFAEDQTLCYWNLPASEWSNERASLFVGQSLGELEALGLPALPDLMKEPGWHGEAMKIRLEKEGGLAVVIPIKTLHGRHVSVLALLPDLDRQPDTPEREVIGDVFSWLMQHGDALARAEVPMTEQSQQLIQSEKMAAIGQLAAGVAHEINNPIGYINSNLNALSHYVNQLMGLVNMIDTANDLDEVKSQLHAIDYAFLRDDIQDCIRESTEGATRVRDIIAALKDFSHADDGRMEHCDLKEVFQTTLKLVYNEVKYRCEVVEEYGPGVSATCNANQMKQVAMNLIVNAAHAIEQQGTIRISTGEDETGAWFKVEDNGEGIPHSVQKRIFEPFYTTKPVGRGTGLGLSLSYNIMQRHGGSLTFESTPGKGTVFTGWIPRNGKAPGVE